MGPDDNKTSIPDGLTADESQLINDFRRCSPRRQEAVRRFTHKLAQLEVPIKTLTNILQFKRRKDDWPNLP